MINRIKKISFFVILCLLAHGTSEAQTQNEFTALLNRFDRNLEQVRELVHTFNNLRGIQFANEAEGLRNNAVTFFNNNNFVQARVKITMAFSKLEAAVRITLEGPVKRLWGQVETLLERAEHEVLGRNNKEAERLLREAKENFDAAQRARSTVNILKAVEHLRVAKTLAQRALDMVDRLDGQIDHERQKFEILLERAREAVEATDDPRPKQIFQQAVRLARAAEEALRNGNIPLAKKLLNQATLLLLRVIDIASLDAAASPARIEARFYKLREALDEVSTDMDDAKNPRAHRLYDRAKRLSNEAEFSAKEGHTQAAMIKIDLAEKMLQRAVRMVHRQDRQVSDRVSDEIVHTRNEIAGARSQLNDLSKDGQVLLNMAEFSVNKAERASAAGFPRIALEALLAAQRFLTKAARVEAASSGAETRKDAVMLRLSQLDIAISDSESNISQANNSWAYRLLQSAKEIRNLSFQSIQKGNLTAANEGIQVAFDLVHKSNRNNKSEP